MSDATSAVAATSAAESTYDSVLVTGGTGFLGLHTCQFFANGGWDVTALDLKPFAPEDDTEGITYEEGDVRDEERIGEVIEAADADVVVHAAAALPLWDDATIREVTIDGTRSVLWAAEEAGIELLVSTYYFTPLPAGLYASMPYAKSMTS
ncbi:hypothetical protein BRC68_10270, partial [Halobacteriales archaeon QH_6_64_20]